MDAVEAQTTGHSTRLKRLIRLYETGQASEFMDRLLDKVFAQEADEERALISRLAADMSEFEARYDLDSDTFYERFTSGELGDAIDYFEWAALCDMHEQAKARLAVLTE